MRKILFMITALLLVGAQGRAMERDREAPAAGAFEVSLLLDQGDGEILASGSEVSFSVRVTRDSYVILYNIDTEGRIHLLYPERRSDLARVQAGTILSIPPSGPAWKAGSGAGMEFVQVIATTRRDLIDENELSFLETGDPPRIPEDPFLVMNTMADRLIRAPARNREVAFDYTFFYVDERVDYPRIVCPAYAKGEGEGCQDYAIRTIDLYQRSFPYRAGWEVSPRRAGDSSSLADYEGSSEPPAGYAGQPEFGEDARGSTASGVTIIEQPVYYPVTYDPWGWGLTIGAYTGSLWWNVWWGDPWYYYPSYYAYYPSSWYGCYPWWGSYAYGYSSYSYGPYRYHDGSYRYRSYSTTASYKKGGTRDQGRRSYSARAGGHTRSYDARVRAKHDRFAGSRSRSDHGIRTRTSTRSGFDTRYRAKGERFRSYRGGNRATTRRHVAPSTGRTRSGHPYVAPRLRSSYRTQPSGRLRWQRSSAGTIRGSRGTATHRGWSPAHRGSWSGSRTRGTSLRRSSGRGGVRGHGVSRSRGGSSRGHRR